MKELYASMSDEDFHEVLGAVLAEAASRGLALEMPAEATEATPAAPVEAKPARSKPARSKPKN